MNLVPSNSDVVASESESARERLLQYGKSVLEAVYVQHEIEQDAEEAILTALESMTDAKNAEWIVARFNGDIVSAYCSLTNRDPKFLIPFSESRRIIPPVQCQYPKQA
jgi:hypothetical protein